MSNLCIPEISDQFHQLISDFETQIQQKQEEIQALKQTRDRIVHNFQSVCDHEWGTVIPSSDPYESFQEQICHTCNLIRRI